MDHIKRRIQEGDPKVTCFCEDVEGTMWFKDRLIVPKIEVLKKKILYEAHMLRYSIHPGSTKMNHDLRQQFWWTRIKHETARYVLECDTYQKVKDDYMKFGGLHYGLIVDCPQVRLDLGDRGSTHQIHPLHRSCVMSAQSSKDDHL
jgi:hypothetical protein